HGGHLPYAARKRGRQPHSATVERRNARPQICTAHYCCCCNRLSRPAPDHPEIVSRTPFCREALRERRLNRAPRLCDGHAFPYWIALARPVLNWNSRDHRMGMGNERFRERSGISASDGDRAALRLERNSVLWCSGLWFGSSIHTNLTIAGELILCW